jgi:hypothetical protein
MQLTSLSLALTRAGFRSLAFNPLDLFANSEPGAWYDPSDLTTLFQDAAGTTAVTAVEQPVGRMLDKSGNGAHATQATATSRPVLSARVNLLLDTETLATQTLTTRATTQRLRFEGDGSITLSGTATGTFAAGTHTVTTTAGTLTVTVSGSVLRADLRAANEAIGSPDYQRVNTATDYDTVGFPHYLRCDGIDDGMVTSTITPGTDKAQVFAGVRKLSDAATAIIYELSPDESANNGSIGCYAPLTIFEYSIRSRGTAVPTSDNRANVDSAQYAAPVTNVFSALHDMASDSTALRLNGSQVAQSTADQGTGNLLAYPLYLFRRGGTSLPFNGHFYGVIIRFGDNLPIETIEQAEVWMAAKTGVTL